MACDHLNPGQFQNSMLAIKTYYRSMCNAYNNSVKDAIMAYYDAWQSNKGWTKIQKLDAEIRLALNTCGQRILENYSTMRYGGIQYVRNQDGNLEIEEMYQEELDGQGKTFAEGSEIIVDEEKIAAAGEKLKAGLKTMNRFIDDAKEVTNSDGSFGYWSTGDNPRQTMFTSFVALDNALEQAANKFVSEMDEILTADKAAREAAKQASVVNASDISGIF